ncbi:quinol dehydrogenase ferredoxin subunit NapH [Oryzomicrobium sp.]|uniref:quinol dehydrogenase ferredoxin subunit NapH n=1 Tax=Oryzomicrobium sp. TaxID=1911578 RepID=UPI002FE252CC
MAATMPPGTPSAAPARMARPGLESVRVRGWLAAHKWLLLRRIVQLSILALFLAGPWFGVWLVKGNLTSSLTLGVLPLTDPYALLQSLAAGHWPYKTALIGAAIVLAFYLLVGGRVFCGWVCPVNLVTDAAAWSRRRLGLKTGKTPAEATRRWLLGATLVASALSGGIAWEWVNPVSFFHRSLFFGWGLGWLALAAVFAYDLTASRGWCGHLCPMGAFYSLLGKTALVRVAAPARSRCNDCMDCFAVCPEPQVIRPALKGSGSPVILASDCTTCGRCVDVCAQDVFRLSHRFDQRSMS